MSGKDPDDVRAIVNTLLVPMDPPNRSQWRKLELAMKFISISKQSAGVTKQVSALIELIGWKSKWNVED